MHRHTTPLTLLCLLAIAPLASAQMAPPPADKPARTGSVVFIHPDGASASTWHAGRVFLVGPDGDLAWDKLPAVALYRDHMADSLSASSNAGGTIHAYGIKAPYNAYGTDGTKPITDDKGRSTSVMHQALRAGLPVGIINSGSIIEPGTGCFLASVPSRADHEAITSQIIDSGARVILAGGEEWLLPKGVMGRHGEGQRTDGRNLIEEARAKGFHVVFTATELAATPDGTTHLLGIFCTGNTYNSGTEEQLGKAGTPLYKPGTPTLGDMTRTALKVMARSGKRFFLMIEEEGTDDFGNANNAQGVFEAIRRADDAMASSLRFVADHPNTLLITAADSDAGGMRLLGFPESKMPLDKPLPASGPNGAPIDGRGGTGSLPFVARPDRTGLVMPFGIVWATTHDASGGVVVRAAGLNSAMVRGSLDNTRIAAIIRATLFGDENANP